MQKKKGGRLMRVRGREGDEKKREWKCDMQSFTVKAVIMYCKCANKIRIAFIATKDGYMQCYLHKRLHLGNL